MLSYCSCRELHKARDIVADVPAVYFVMPTAENIARICQVRIEFTLYHPALGFTLFPLYVLVNVAIVCVDQRCCDVFRLSSHIRMYFSARFFSHSLFFIILFLFLAFLGHPWWNVRNLLLQFHLCCATPASRRAGDSGSGG